MPDLSNSKGIHTNAIYGFLNIMMRILEEEKPEYFVVAFDEHGPTFRHALFSEYKATRKPMPMELREQEPVMRELLQKMKIKMVSQVGLEADDILGTLAVRAEREGLAVSLVSGDRDLLQIASEQIKIRLPKSKGGRTEIEDYHAEDVRRVYQVTPAQFIDVKALVGDTSDNIPGVPKIGEKTATELIGQFGSLAGIYEHLDEVSKPSVKAALEAHRDLAELSRQLATINVDSEIDCPLEEAEVGEFFTDEAYPLFQELELKSYLKRFGDAPCG
jgi:DNA polymerase-1